MQELNYESIEDFYLESNLRQDKEYYGKRLWFVCPNCKYETFQLVKECDHHHDFNLKGFIIGRCCKTHFKILLN